MSGRPKGAGTWTATSKRATDVGYARGGRLTAEERNALPDKDFALPGRRYPLNDESHARNALARVSQFGSPAEKEKVRDKVHRKYPGIDQDDD